MFRAAHFIISGQLLIEAKPSCEGAGPGSLPSRFLVAGWSRGVTKSRIQPPRPIRTCLRVRRTLLPLRKCMYFYRAALPREASAGLGLHRRDTPARSVLSV